MEVINNDSMLSAANQTDNLDVVESVIQSDGKAVAMVVINSDNEE